MRRLAMAGAALTGSLLGLADCSSATSSVPIESNYVACAAVDAEFSFLLRHDSVPEYIGEKVISEGEKAADASLRAAAQAISNDVAGDHVRGVEVNLAAMARRCDALGVGPTKYELPPPTSTTTQG